MRRSWHRALALAGVLALVGACAQQPTPPAAGTGQPGGTATFTRGAGGDLRILYWQAPTILNAHQAGGTKDTDASRVVLEPLAALDKDGNPTPRLAAEIPTPQNGGVSADLKTVTWKLKQGVKWSDGTPFTADDVVFTHTYICDKATGSISIGTCTNVASVTKKDANTVVVTYTNPQPYFYQWGTGNTGEVLQQAQYKGCVGAAAKACPADQKPIGTGPYKVKEFKPGDVILFEANENYRDANRPYFKTITWKGGGDATAAARAVFQTGDADYAWNLQVESAVLSGMATSSTLANLVVEFTTSLERIVVNHANPAASLGEKRSDPDSKHPYFSDKAVRRALAMATDRATVATQLYGVAGRPTCNVINAPENQVSKATANLDVCKFDTAAAERELEQAGWVKGADGVRAKGGVRLEMSYNTSVNPVRQKTQDIMKANWEKIGFKVTLKSTPAATFFTNTSPDGYLKFYTDVEEYANSPGPPDWASFLDDWSCGLRVSSANNWNNDNVERYCNPAFDALVEQIRKEVDKTKLAQLVIQANDMLVSDVAVIPLVHRSGATVGVAKSLKGVVISGWDSEMYDIASWHK